MSDPVATVPKDLPREKRDGRSPRARPKVQAPAQSGSSESERAKELAKIHPEIGRNIDAVI